MKRFLTVGMTLALICAVAATTLAAVNAITKNKIIAYEQEVVEDALSVVAKGLAIGQLNQSEDPSILEYYQLMNASNGIEGYIVMVLGSGYGGEMTVLASYAVDGSVMAAKLLGNAETPGLGKKAEADGYMDKFIGTGGNSSPVPVKKTELGNTDAESISGATVTFSGIAKALAYGSAFVTSMGGK
ncbi:MAG: FMN-binding protein [Sphaerochaetaceae bacterium]|mgnify:CR=1 FL=1|jgi:electron transport complex protein RnfG|nr:FMN-binding protein [Sphaerochaetaceae bacterium]NLO61304.1 FMN-binding protein [Spirochaetales bacterium]MDD2405601.1 FMN-binding protein [Sphaerochaetaceae bacterium]MDD3671349.1 FMN-binding protein [Sphaerochaetaceae bacterium]MDD4259651.1 FMN-binding protein [Sphaerochaetaceae bacterium]